MLALWTGGCTSDDEGAVAASSSSGSGGSLPAPDAGPPISAKANVKFKRGERIRNDFSRALGLDPSELCNELGKYSCTDFVHNVALGGVDPYGAGLYEALPFTTATTPEAVDRVALSGCIARTDEDLAAQATPVLWIGLQIDADGKLQNLDSDAVRGDIDSLYTRAMQRHAKKGEIQLLQGLYTSIEQKGGATPARDWAVLSCFTVLTTMESLFY